MARFKKGDTARLNFRDSKKSRYGENGRIATTVKYIGNSMWQVKLESGKLRKWFTADMDNITQLQDVQGDTRYEELVEELRELVEV
jgi:hypothetical protein